MKIISKNYGDYPNYYNERIIEVFLWFPKCLRGETLWLTKAKIKQRYRVGHTGDYWQDMGFVG